MSEIFNLIPVMTSNTTPSGEASASSSYSGFEAWKAFNGIADGGWQADSGTSWWLMYDFGETSKALVTKYSITASTNAGNARSPKNWTFEGSNDGIQWSVLDTQVNQINWTVGLVREYSFNNEYSFRYYRLNISANNTTDVYTNVGELKLFGFIPRINKFLILTNDENFINIDGGDYGENLIPTLTSNTSNGEASSDSTHATLLPYQAFDGKETTFWGSSGYGTTISWLKYKFIDKKNVNKYTIYPREGLINTPNSWTFEGSNDDSNWTILDTQTNVTDWVDKSVKEFIFPNDNEFLSYRINITQSNGTAIQIAELKFYSEKKSSLKIFSTQSEQNFITHGMDKSTVFDLNSQITNKIFIEQSPTALGSGKVFSKTIDTTKTPIKKVSIK